MVVDGRTIKWWMEQEDGARKLLTKQNSVHIRHALVMLNNLLSDEDFVWGNSARFDLGILEKAYDICRIPFPVNHRNERCLRTIASLSLETKETTTFVGTKHDPMADCLHQVKYLTEINKQLNLNIK